MEKENFNLYNFYQTIKSDNIIFCYSGPISHSIIEGIGHTLKLDLEIEEVGQNASQCLFSILIEQMQNVLNYSVEKIVQDINIEKELKMGVLVIGYEVGNFYIYCGNKILNKDIPKLKSKIDELSTLDKLQLKVLYKERRRSQPEEGSKGAGLGFIEMARKSGKPLQYSFQKLDEDVSFFAIKVLVTRRS